MTITAVLQAVDGTGVEAVHGVPCIEQITIARGRG